MTHNDPQIKQVRVGDLIVDPSVQRHLDPNRVKRMARDFDRAALGAVTVSVRPDGSMHVIDGQHRVSLVLSIEGDDALIPAVVYTGLSRQDEAAYFRKLNATKQVHALDRFRVRLVEGDPVAVRLASILDEFGWRIAAGKEHGKFAAINELERIYHGAGIRRGSEHPQAVRSAIKVLTEAWGTTPDAVRRELVSGVGMVFVRHPDADESKITRELALQGSPMQVVSAARARVSNKHQTLGNVMAALVIELHNKKRRTNRLPAWEV